VLIAGGGVAGIEALLALHDLAGDRVELALVSADRDFVYKPLLVEEPFGLDPAEQHALEPLAEELGGSFLASAVTGVDPEAHRVELPDDSLTYDYLMVCLGGRFRPAFEGVTTFPSGHEQLRIDELLQRASGGEGGIAFVVPPAVTWALPLYEIALMTQRRAHESGLGELPLRLITPEPSPLSVFGQAASAAVSELLSARGIEFVGLTRVHQEDGEFVLTPGDRPLEAAEVVALPAMEGPSLPGLPANDAGFIPIDEHARVLGLQDVYAAGDGTNFPIKQGGIATQQADAAAADIAHRLGAPVEPEPFRPVLRGKLLTGAESVHMRSDLAGGAGEGQSSLDTLWWPPHKISGRYLAPWLYHSEVQAEPEPPRQSLDVEVALPKEWHQQPMATEQGEPPRVE
jgi:sulfide:quinone oxidoreductase